MSVDDSNEMWTTPRLHGTEGTCTPFWPPTIVIVNWTHTKGTATTRALQNKKRGK